MLFLVVSLAQAQVVDRAEPVQGAARSAPIAAVVLHSTGGFACDPALRYKAGTLGGHVSWFKKRTDGISIHYVVGPDGTVVSMVPEDQSAAHCRGHNADSIGIEMVNAGDGRAPYPEAQQQAVVGLLADILRRNGLGISAVRTHAELDNRTVRCETGEDGAWTAIPDPAGVPRRTDPGAAFPLESIRQSVADAL